MMKQQHSEAFREQALRKVFERGSRPIRAVADDLGLNIGTLKGWMKVTRARGRQGLAANAGVVPLDSETSSGRMELLLASASVRRHDASMMLGLTCPTLPLALHIGILSAVDHDGPIVHVSESSAPDSTTR